jgi:hypothetical protein
VDIRFPPKDPDKQFDAAMLRVFEDRAKELPDSLRVLLKELWLDGHHTGHTQKIQATIEEGIRRCYLDPETRNIILDCPSPPTK